MMLCLVFILYNKGKGYSKHWAESKRCQGNEEYSKGEYEKAIKSYSIAIFISPNEIEYYGNRIACYMTLKDYKTALNDLYCTLKINPKYEKGYSRMIKCYFALGDISGIEYSIKCYKNLIKNALYENTISEYEKQLQKLKDLKISKQIYFYNKNYESCLSDLEKSLNISPECVLLIYEKVECLIFLNRLEESKKFLEKSLKILTLNSIDLLYLSVLYSYHIGDIVKCISLCEGNYILIKDHMKINTLYNEVKLINYKNMEADKFIENEDYNQAIIIYNVAIEYQTLSRSIQSTLYFNRALVYFEMKLFFKALADCEEAIKISSKIKKFHLEPKHLKVLYLSAQYYFELEYMEKCVKFCEYALDIAITEEIKVLLNEAQFEIYKRNERKIQEEKEAKRKIEEEKMQEEERKWREAWVRGEEFRREEERQREAASRKEKERREEEERKRREEQWKEKKRREEEAKKREEERKREERSKQEEERRRESERKKEEERKRDEEMKREAERRKEREKREEEEKRQNEEKRRANEERKQQENRRKNWEEQQKKNEEKRKRNEHRWKEEQRKYDNERQQKQDQQRQQQRNQKDNKNKSNANNNNSRTFVRDTNGYYKAMGLNTNATYEQIKSAYKTLAKQYHPDKHPNSPAKEKNQEIFKRITEAYRILSDPVEKYDYDRS